MPHPTRQFFTRHAMSCHHRRCYGVTLIELLTTLSVAAILATIAAPSFSALIADQRAKSAASSLYVSLSRARSEAMMRNVGVTLAPKNNAWANGWQLIDLRHPQNPLEVKDAMQGLSITGPSSLTYHRSGMIDGSVTHTFLVTASGHAGATRCISVEPGGRPYLKAGTSC